MGAVDDPGGGRSWTRLLFAGARPLALLVGLYLVARLVVLVVTLMQGNVFVSYDTITYSLRGDPAIDRGPVLSFVGHAPRLWGVPLFYTLLPSDALRAVGQWIVGSLAWVSLAVVVWCHLRAQVAKVRGAAAVLLLALHDVVTNWDLAMLSESLSVSLGVLVVAQLLYWLRTGSRLALAGATLVACWWTFTRPDIRVLTVILVVSLIGIAWKVPARRRGALLSAGLFLVAIGWCTAIMPNVTETGRRYSAFGAEHSVDEWLLFRLRVQVLPDPATKAVFTEQLGLPACPAAEAIATRAAWDMLEFADAYYSCPSLAAWGAANRDTVFWRFAAADPVQYTRMTVGLLNESVLGGRYADVPSVIPPPSQKLAFPGIRWALLSVLLSVAVAAGAVLATRAVRADGLLVKAASVLGLACAASTVAGVVYGTGEFWRFGVQEAIGFRIVVCLLLAAALDAWLLRRQPPSERDQAGDEVMVAAQ